MPEESVPSVSRPTLSRDQVIDAAIALADASGIEALTMRNLARELGVKAMSLYNHVENKDDLLDGMVDQVTAEIELPEAGANWRLAIRRSAVSARDAFLRHPWASNLWMSRRSYSSARVRRGDWMLRRLREAGLPKELVYHGFHILETHIMGSILHQQNFPYLGEELAGVAREFMQQISPTEHADFLEHIEQHLEPQQTETSGFEFALDLILDGLERAADSG